MFQPVYKNYPWGGNRIPETYHRNLPSGTYAESWEITDHSDGMSIIENGTYTGESFRSLLQRAPKMIIGNKTKDDAFPLLIKLIDASKKLSVQVHPNDQTAAQYGGEPKTEMWYLLGDNPSIVYCGLQPNTTQEQFLDAVENNTSEKLYNKYLFEKIVLSLFVVDTFMRLTAAASF